jgi:hypothetical protein
MCPFVAVAEIDTDYVRTHLHNVLISRHLYHWHTCNMFFVGC